jgi:hypothetical protein
MTLSLSSWRRSTVAALAVLATSAVACGPQATDASQPLVTDVAHSAVKRQSIGNCWLYAQATWLESKRLAATGVEVDVSESYWTYWHWYSQLVGTSTTEIRTGGTWTTSTRIISQYGWVLEKDFIAEEEGTEMSGRQASALAAINAELQPGGTLDTPAKRTPARVRAELDRAWGASMALALTKRKTAAQTLVEVRADGTKISLADAIGGSSSRRWNEVYFPRLYGKDAVAGAYVRRQRADIMKRVFRALNDKQPVVMSVMIDFNAMDVTTEGTFDADLLAQSGPGHQGGHMVTLEDYTVDNVPGYGTLGEGDMDAAAKAAAVNGRLVYLKSKNSWGKNRPERGLTDGYTRFKANYLFGQLGWKDDPESDDSGVSYYTTLTDFVLPPGY